MRQTITLRIPPGQTLEEFAQEQDLVQVDDGNGGTIYVHVLDTPEAQAEEERATEAVAELGVAMAKLMGPFLERIGEQRVGELLVAQGVYHIAKTGGSVLHLMKVFGLAMEEATGQLTDEFEDLINSEGGLTMARVSPEEDKDARLQQAKGYMARCANSACGTPLASCWACLYIRRHEAEQAEGTKH